jgi:transposase
MIYEEGLSISQAAKKLGMPVRTAQSWHEKDQDDPQDVIQRKQTKKNLMEDHQS